MQYRLVKYGDVIPPLDHPELTVKSLAENLMSFIFEMQKQDGTEFPPDSLHHIVSGIQRFLRWNGKPESIFLRIGDLLTFESA